MRIAESTACHVCLAVHRCDSVFTARWLESEQQSELFEIELPVTANASADLRWYLETYPQFPGTGDRILAEDVEKRILAWGQALSGTVFTGSFGAGVRRRLLDAARAGYSALLSIAAEEPEVLLQPWEVMFGEEQPLLLDGVTIRRQLVAESPNSLEVGNRLDLPLRVLLIVSRPTDTGFIDPRTSTESIFDALDALPPGNVTVDFCEPPNFKKLSKIIAAARSESRPFHIVHFDGHGTFMPRSGVGALAFERDNSEATELIEGGRLGELLARQEVPLFVLEACRSSDLSDRPVHRSVAPALLARGVRSVIAFSHSVHVEAARLLVKQFYRELVEGRTVGQALDAARTRLHAQQKRWLHLGPNAATVKLQDWFVPQLYQIGQDRMLVEAARDLRIQQRGRAATAMAKRLRGFPPEPIYRFHGRALERVAIERAFRRSSAVLLAGMGGTGKTALARDSASWWLRTGQFEVSVFYSFEQKMGADRLVREFGQALNGEGFSALPQDEQWKMAVELFHTNRVLFVWDNFESTLEAFQAGEKAEELLGVFGASDRHRLSTLYRDLTQGEPLGRLLVTCRSERVYLQEIEPIMLGPLARPDSLHLLSAILDGNRIPTDRPGYEREEIDALLNTLDDHPLSLSLVAPHLKHCTPSGIRRDLQVDLARFSHAGPKELRNRSLLSSFEYSKRRLSLQAREILPLIAWFEGGVFEKVFVGFSEVDPRAWETIREELVATALLYVDELDWINTPFLRIHPTLPFAVRWQDVADRVVTEERFIGVYRRVTMNAHRALSGEHSAAALAHIGLEEANVRSAMARAFHRNDQTGGAQLANTLDFFLGMTGRQRERNALADWVRAQVPKRPKIDAASWVASLQHAKSLAGQGDPAKAASLMKRLIAQLEIQEIENSEEMIAISHSALAHIYLYANRPDLAILSARCAIERLEKLPNVESRQNLAASFCDLASALLASGRFEEAWDAAESSIELNRALGLQREVAVGLSITAKILADQQKWSESDARYVEALVASRAAGDRRGEAVLTQDRAILKTQQGKYEEATKLGKKALTLWQREGDVKSEMQIYDLLGSIERDQTRCDAAEAWYARSRELATELGDRAHLAIVAHNVGILHQIRFAQIEDPTTRDMELLRQAKSCIRESLVINLDMKNRRSAAASYLELGLIHRRLREFRRSEENLRRSLRIWGSMSHPEVLKVYLALNRLACDRGDTRAAAAWKAKYDAKLTQLRELRQGRDAPKNGEMTGL